LQLKNSLITLPVKKEFPLKSVQYKSQFLKKKKYIKQIYHLKEINEKQLKGSEKGRRSN
jgi:hypothetical protein